MPVHRGLGANMADRARAAAQRLDLPAGGQRRLGDVPADEAGGAGYEDFHAGIIGDWCAADSFRYTEIVSARSEIEAAVLSWPGTRANPHRFGGVEFTLGTREIGHLHGNSLADIPFPTKVRDELIAAGLAQPHHILPDTGWISFRIRSDEDVQAAIALFKRSYDIANKQKTK